MQQRLAEHDGLIVRLVMRGVDQGQAPFSRERSQLCHELPLLRKLRPIAATKLLPTLRVVSEPLAQLSARGDLLHPLSDVGIGLRHAARPQSVDEDPGAIARPGRLVSPLDTHSRSCFGLAHRYLQGGRASELLRTHVGYICRSGYPTASRYVQVRTCLECTLKPLSGLPESAP